MLTMGRHAVTVMWNDLELYHDYRDFTVDPVTFPAEEMRDFIRTLVRRPV
jgi:alpha-glucosidase